MALIARNAIANASACNGRGSLIPFTRRFMTTWTGLPAGRWISAFGQVLQEKIIVKDGEWPSGFPAPTPLPA